MKKLIFTFILIPALTHAGWFEKKPDPDHDQRIHAEDQLVSIQNQLDETRQQLRQEHLSNSRWQSTSMVLGIACPILLVLGATLGANTGRKHAKES